ncbi:probable membrane-associated kinase regulator 4 [Andrographis paniculata]|uniref:probable membrane-associated kinase regulator 4 n=1 Tax=Andrographis paniculata TaxID=175694 RepID=UPI0021E7A921|nr:probable membrane-associated kinase regulator 4 [Andrographis paniculata]
MASNPSKEEEEDYIDMELITSSPQSTEFEFTCNDKESTTSPADELFYNGKLLPLHLLRAAAAAAATTKFNVSKASFENEEEEEDVFYSMPLPKCSTAPCTNTANTPADSVNISPSESCRASCELNHDDDNYFFEWSTELTGFISNRQPTKKSNWSKKLKIIKHNILAHKLRASRAYLKSLFGKSDEPGSTNSSAGNFSGANECSEKHSKISKRIPFRVIGRTPYPTIAAIMKDGDRENVHRRSFSGAIKRHSPNKSLSSSSSNSSSGASSSSSSFSLNSTGLSELQFLRRSTSAKEIESSIEAAIAHCKKSQQVFDSRNSSGEPEICSQI